MNVKQLIDFLKRFPEAIEPKIQVGQVCLPLKTIIFDIDDGLLILTTQKESGKKE